MQSKLGWPCKSREFRLRNEAPRLLIHTASLYRWFEPYPETLEDRIHAALDAGLDGVEISNGVAILDWKPTVDTVRRLRDKTVAIHAELLRGLTLDEWVAAIEELPFNFTHAVFHPDELQPEDFAKLSDLPFPATVENMDATHGDWRTATEIQRVMPAGLSAGAQAGVGFTFDTAHAMEHGLDVRDFDVLRPREVHLSLSNSSGSHVMTHVAPADFPILPPICPMVTLEGLVPADQTALEDEVAFVRERLQGE